jgi:hypothetical protein
LLHSKKTPYNLKIDSWTPSSNEHSLGVPKGRKRGLGMSSFIILLELVASLYESLVGGTGFEPVTLGV